MRARRNCRFEIPNHNRADTHLTCEGSKRRLIRMPSIKKKTLEFTYTEKNGTLPIEEWLILGLKEFAKQN